MQDFIDEVKPTDDADWLTLVRAARAATRERIEDYIAAATAAGPARARTPAAGSRSSDDRRGARGRRCVLAACVGADDRRCCGAGARPTRRVLKILSPGDDAYVSGPTLLRAQRRRRPTR